MMNKYYLVLILLLLMSVNSLLLLSLRLIILVMKVISYAGMNVMRVQPFIKILRPYLSKVGVHDG